MILDVRCPGRTGLNVIKPNQLSHEARDGRGSAIDCDRNRFILNYRVMGRTVEAKVKIVVLVMSESGIRNTIRAVNLSPTTVFATRHNLGGLFVSSLSSTKRKESTQSPISHVPAGNPARHLNRLTALVSGIVSR